MRLRSLLLACTVALVVTGTAKADSIFTLGTSNDNGTSGPGPYARLDINLTSPTTAVFTYTALGSFVFGEMGGNLNASNFSIGAVTFTLAPSSNQTPTYSDNPGSSLDGFGNFVIDETPSPNGFSSAVIEAQFTVTNTSGTWLSSAAVLTPDNQGEEAAVHSFTANGGSFYSAAAAPDPTPVSEPASLAVLGIGLASLGFAVRRRAL